jgi:hypothetical protein
LVALTGCDGIKVLGGGDRPLVNTGGGGIGGMPMSSGGSAGSGTGGTGFDDWGNGGGCGGPACSEQFEPNDACNPFGAFTVIETGPPDSWAPDGYHGPFDIVSTAQEGDWCGLPYLEGYSTRFVPATCTLEGKTLVSGDCTEESGQSLCSWVYKEFDLNFASTPATGTVRIWCDGECGFDSSAPIEATPKP